MNYEDFYNDLQDSIKSLKDTSAQGQKLYKAIVKDTDKGDVRDLAKQLASIEEATRRQMEAAAALRARLEGFDAAAYFESGDFTRQMLECAREKGVDVAGENPVFEMFPYKVRIDAANQDVYLNRKKLPSMRPGQIIDMVASEQDRLNRANFNAQTFITDLENGYEMAILKGKKRPNAVILLNNIYKMMVPMSRSRRDYDIMSFAYDIARLYNSGIRADKNGRRFDLGTSRDGKTGIRILDTAGHEQFVSTLKFFDTEE